MFGDRVRFKRSYHALHLASGTERVCETAKECTMAELLAQCNDWTRRNPRQFVYFVPERTQPEIGDLNVKEW